MLAAVAVLLLVLWLGGEAYGYCSCCSTNRHCFCDAGAIRCPTRLSAPHGRAAVRPCAGAGTSRSLHAVATVGSLLPASSATASDYADNDGMYGPFSDLLRSQLKLLVLATAARTAEIYLYDVSVESSDNKHVDSLKDSDEAGSASGDVRRLSLVCSYDNFDPSLAWLGQSGDAAQENNADPTWRGAVDGSLLTIPLSYSKDDNTAGALARGIDSTDIGSSRTSGNDVFGVLRVEAPPHVIEDCRGGPRSGNYWELQFQSRQLAEVTAAALGTSIFLELQRIEGNMEDYLDYLQVKNS